MLLVHYSSLLSGIAELHLAIPAVGDGANCEDLSPEPEAGTANLRTEIMDFKRVGLKHNLNVTGWNSQAHREFPGKFESSNAGIILVGRLGVGMGALTCTGPRSLSASPGISFFYSFFFELKFLLL